MKSQTIKRHTCACGVPATETASADLGAAFTRRDFLFAGVLSLVAMPLAALATGGELPPGAVMLKATYPKQHIGWISKLVEGRGLMFDYPRPGLANLLVKLGAEAGGGLGAGRDVVAFSLRCTHMGGDLSAAFQAGQYKLGPCPRHLTSFDLTRHGVVITGSATESLPQIVLQTEGDAIYAVGVMGLIYGEAGEGLA